MCWQRVSDIITINRHIKPQDLSGLVWVFPDLKHILSIFAKIFQKFLLCLQFTVGSDDYCPAHPAVTANFMQGQVPVVSLVVLSLF